MGVDPSLSHPNNLSWTADDPKDTVDLPASIPLQRSCVEPILTTTAPTQPAHSEYSVGALRFYPSSLRDLIPYHHMTV